jgi:3-deoxy-D-manno-octulosonate 8-phosphate phosphatase (KDO 8-P phosphatase)
MSETLHQRCLAVSLLVLDVDGVLTEGGIVHGDDGREWKQFHVRDGTALKAWQKAGLKTAIVTGRRSNAVLTRAAELGIVHVVQGAADKDAALSQVLNAAGVAVEATCYVGDDLADLAPMLRCRLAAAAADACAEVRAAAQFITQRDGGRAAVREVVELVLRCQGRWQI